MKKSEIEVNGIKIPIIALDCAVIGSGCAGLNAADWLYDLGRRDIAVITEGINMGTSRNTGSDKQTYYKLSLASDGEDSVAQMADTLFSGSGVHGDIALAEAACSVKCFIKLANLGVPFPTSEYGEYVGYKTDHDPRQRATSAGPLTSKYMTECLERSVRQKGVEILDGMTAVKLITSENRVEAVLCLDHSLLDSPSRGICVVRVRHVILATGGPASCYFSSVYPHSQTGMSGIALEAGAHAANLQEWQYGLASTKFRWNVSGTYQQALPKYISVDKDGVEREFLTDYYSDHHEALNMVFLKGYQWPFDVKKIQGSSMIDILVHREIHELGRKVFLDFRADPTGLENGFGGLGREAFDYLKNSHALIATPIKRLAKMNPLAIELYKNNAIDLYSEPLEIAVCAQHHNGGIAVDHNWQTSIEGLYAAGEAAGTFGVYRPGGTALNSTQVGSMRAAEHITYSTKPDEGFTDDFITLAGQVAENLLKDFGRVLSKNNKSSNLINMRESISKQMSMYAGHIRDIKEIARLKAEVESRLGNIYTEADIGGPDELPELMKNRDILTTQAAVLSAMLESAGKYGSRGSALVLRDDNHSDGSDGFHYRPPVETNINEIVVTEKTMNGFRSAFAPVREIPKSDAWFENVWGEYRERVKR